MGHINKSLKDKMISNEELRLLSQRLALSSDLCCYDDAGATIMISLLRLRK